MNIAIITKYCAQTDARSSGYLAKAHIRGKERKLFTERNHELDAYGNAVAAARRLAEKYKLAGFWYESIMPSGVGRVFTCWKQGGSYLDADFSVYLKGHVPK